jgi:hypothetical protein
MTPIIAISYLMIIIIEDQSEIKYCEKWYSV